ncbi:ABC transporter substrate-binding protein [Pollutimonas bauzanensis]|uniref:Iron(III) transport system substrate-binding protein n=1 Tax=Pollutimonas bauzanensis TaxID=658167 RepID=A0A1M5ZTI3_9BURK|nr:extracellular solute-binding protein [Pollutimonas bauzanensis]SHI27478.1 iron(III) transport system substrate-binding protein [Pollutimonas bauzanensis]
MYNIDQADTKTKRMGLVPRLLLGALLAGMGFTVNAAAAGAAFGGAGLIAAAEKEGKLVLYTANQLESEQDLVAAFNKRFPNVKVEIVRAPGSRLATRIETEVAANKLTADVIDMSDRGLVASFQEVFADYAPPNANLYPAKTKDLKNLWPKTSWGFVIAYNVPSGVEPPKSWKDLADSKYEGKVGIVVANSGGSTWTRAMFERQELGEDYWARLAANKPVLYPSGAPAASGIVRGEVLLGGVQSNAVIPSIKKGSPLKVVYPPEGIPVTTSVAGVVKTAAHPNAARLYMNWVLSQEGQSAWVTQGGGFSVLEGAPQPDGASASTKLWIPDAKEYIALRTQWISDWDKTFNHK